MEDEADVGTSLIHTEKILSKIEDFSKMQVIRTEVSEVPILIHELSMVTSIYSRFDNVMAAKSALISPF